MKISIVIPTADRHKLLNDTLINLLEESMRSELFIPIVIVDNASSPPITHETLTGIIDGNHQITIHRFENRVVINESFIRACEIATTEYIWLFGDDDYVRPGAFRNICWHIHTHNPVYIYVNRYIADSDMLNIERTEHPLEIGSYVELNGAEAAKRFNHHAGFITSLVVQTKLLQDNVQEYEDRFPGFGFLAAIYDRSLSGKVIYLPSPQIIQRRSITLWRDKWPRFWLVSMPAIFQYLEEKGVRGAHHEVMIEIRRIWIRTLILAKASGIKSTDNFWEHTSKNFKPYERLFVIKLIQWLLPQKIAGSIFKLGMKVLNAIKSNK